MSRALARARNPLLRTPREVHPSPRPSRGHGVAFIASYGEAATFSRSLIELTRALTARDYDVVLVRASSGRVRAAWPETEESIRPTIVYRPNAGYDFGSWAMAIDEFPRLAARDRVLLVNDSLVGPFDTLDAVLDHFERSAADMWAATSTLQFAPHLQSFFFGFHGGILRRYPLSRFWAGIREVGSKDQIIHAYEMGLSRLAGDEMLTTDVFLPAELVVRGEQNPAIDGWRSLLRQGFPFVKRELLRLPHFAPVRALIVDEVRQRFGHDPMDWFETV